MNPIEAIRLIATRVPSVSYEALKSLRATGANQQRRLSWLVAQALRDPEAAWTPEESAALRECINPEPETYSMTFLLRLTPAQHAEVTERAAAETGGNISEYIRRCVFGS